MEKFLEKWMQQKITRQTAETALKGAEQGAFLIRASSSQAGDYVISVMCNVVVEHHVIKHSNDVMVTRSGKVLFFASKKINYEPHTRVCTHACACVQRNAVGVMYPHPFPPLFNAQRVDRVFR